MIFRETKISGAFLIEPEPRVDQRGSFARTWCQEEYQARGLRDRVVQINTSGSIYKGTLRGMHFQRHPHHEAKTVSCTKGAIYDVVLDLRPESPSYLQWDRAELTAASRRMIYIPEGCAHGFQTLTDDSEVLYFMSAFYSPEHSSGVRFDDPSFRIEWPLRVSVISEVDRAWPDFKPVAATLDLVR